MDGERRVLRLDSRKCSHENESWAHTEGMQKNLKLQKLCKQFFFNDC